MFETIKSPQPYIKPFPEFESVFGEPVDLHRKHFLPLVSVDVSVVHNDLDLWLHFVTPIEPLLELDVGYFTEEFHDAYNLAGQFAFRIEDEKYVFAGDFNYFAYESGKIFDAFPDQRDEIEEDYQLRFDSWERNRQTFLQHERINSSAYTPFDPSEPDICGTLVDLLGGEPELGNWQGAGFPVNQNGKPFRFIGEVAPYCYCDDGIQALMMFYDPDEQVVLFRTDWT